MKLTTTDSKSLTYLNCLLVGQSGIGKTTSLQTLPEDATLLAIGERGAIPLRKHKFKVLHFDCWADVQQLYAYALSADEIEDEQIRDAFKDVKILAIDSLSEISDMCCKQIVSVDRPSLAADRGKSKQPLGIYAEQMTQEDWGLYRTRMMRLISAFCHLPYHVIMTCLAAWTENKKTGEVIRTPALSGKTAWECPAHFDVVAYMKSVTNDEGKNQRVWQTFDDGQVLAKDSSGVLAPYEETNWTKLFAKIRGTKEANKE